MFPIDVNRNRVDWPFVDVERAPLVEPFEDKGAR